MIPVGLRFAIHTDLTLQLTGPTPTVDKKSDHLFDFLHIITHNINTLACRKMIMKLMISVCHQTTGGVLSKG
jgi:hypothetical protein